MVQKFSFQPSFEQFVECILEAAEAFANAAEFALFARSSLIYPTLFVVCASKWEASTTEAAAVVHGLAFMAGGERLERIPKTAGRSAQEDQLKIREKLMNIQRQLRTTCVLAVSLAVFTSIGMAAVAQDAAPAGAQQAPPAGAQQAAPEGGQRATIQGLVTGRDASMMYVRTADTPRLTVVLSDSTKATEKGGFLGLGRKDFGITQLVPGLQVKVEGAYNSDHQLIARKITFSRTSYNTASAIDAGLSPTNAQVAAAQDRLRSDRKDIEQSQQDISKDEQDIGTTKQGLDATTATATSNTQGIGKANQRFTTLDQYETKDSVTVNFANGKVAVKKEDQDKLTDFLKGVANTPGYMIQVQGYASAVGSVALNQRLSSERADAVLAIIQQSGVPLTRILAPAAMGITGQVGSNHTRSGQAQNRRVVVTILVNKGITG